MPRNRVAKPVSSSVSGCIGSVLSSLGTRRGNVALLRPGAYGKCRVCGATLMVRLDALLHTSGWRGCIVRRKQHVNEQNAM